MYLSRYGRATESGPENSPSMAQYEGSGRTNYVLLRDEKAYADFQACVALLGGTTEEIEKNGQRLIAAIGHVEDGDFRNSVTVQEIVESGYVSRHLDSKLDATRPEYLALVADWELNADEDRDAADDCDVLFELYPLLARGQVLVFKTVGRAGAINHEGRSAWLSLDDIEEVAARAFALGPLPVAYSRTSEHHYFDYAMWQAEARAGDTQRGYGEWVQAQLEQTAEALEQAQETFDNFGGRGIELAEQIDELRARLEEPTDESPETDAFLNSEARRSPLG